MKLKVKLDEVAYYDNKRWRGGELVDVDDAKLKKVDEAYLKKNPASKLKVGDLLLPRWAVLPKAKLTAAALPPGTPTRTQSPSEALARAAAHDKAAAEAAGNEGDDEDVETEVPGQARGGGGLRAKTAASASVL